MYSENKDKARVGIDKLKLLKPQTVVSQQELTPGSNLDAVSFLFIAIASLEIRTADLLAAKAELERQQSEEKGSRKY